MLFDSFLFFQEIDLLTIRLEYLFPYIDKFIIVESCQTFNGNYKPYNFEKNISKFSKYLEKIHYYKIEDFHINTNSLLDYLNKIKGKELIAKFINEHKHYDKNKFYLLLDSYHRECIHLAFNKFCKSNDTIIFSDLDEIPSIEFIKHIKLRKSIRIPIVCKQYEFKYFLNSLNSNNWNGSIALEYNQIKNKSLNSLRINANNLEGFENGGFHFTSIGGKDLLKNKLENWTHQEYNISIIKKNLDKNIYLGRDIFYRLGVKKNLIINPKNNNIFDNRLSRIILNYDYLIINEFKKESLSNKVNYKFFQFLIYLIRFYNNPVKGFIKVKIYLNKIFHIKNLIKYLNISDK